MVGHRTFGLHSFRFRPLLLFTLSLLWCSGCATRHPRVLWQQTIEQPPTPEVDLHFETHGSGEPILLIHGFGETLDSWRYVVPALSPEHKLIRVDLKGHGASPKPNDERYSLYDQAVLIHRFIIQHDLTNLTLVGHSFGGGVALVTALILAEKGENRVTKLVLIDSIGTRQSLPFFIKVLRMPLMDKIVMAVVPAKSEVRSVLKLAYYDDRKISKESVETYAKALRSPGAKRALEETAKEMIPTDIDALVQKYTTISVPTLLIWGREDRIVPLSVGEFLNRTIPDSKLVVIDACGHIPQEEEPVKTIRAIKDFLATR